MIVTHTITLPGMCLLIAEAITQYVGKAGCREGEINQKRLCYYPFLGERINFLLRMICSVNLTLLLTDLCAAYSDTGLSGTPATMAVLGPIGELLLQ